jgi:sugar-specific transcriptional regulator TrmB
MQLVSGESDLIDRLVRHGLGQGEARCYVGMLAPRAFKVSEVAGEAALPRSRTYELIRSLVRSGLCTEVVGAGVARFRAVPPNEAIGRLEANLAERAARRNAALSTLLQALNGRDALPPGSGQEPLGMLGRPDQVFSAWKRAIGEATAEVVSVAPLNWDTATFPAVAERAAPTVRFRTVHPVAILDSQPHREILQAHASERFLSPYLDRTDLLFSVIDRRIVFLNLIVPGGLVPSDQMESLLVRHTGLAQTLYQEFERLWDRGRSLEQALRGREEPPLSRGDDGRAASGG